MIQCCMSERIEVRVGEQVVIKNETCQVLGSGINGEKGFIIVDDGRGGFIVISGLPAENIDVDKIILPVGEGKIQIKKTL